VHSKGICGGFAIIDVIDINSYNDVECIDEDFLVTDINGEKYVVHDLVELKVLNEGYRFR
jgi:hypothetical protein